MGLLEVLGLFAPYLGAIKAYVVHIVQPFYPLIDALIHAGRAALNGVYVLYQYLYMVLIYLV